MSTARPSFASLLRERLQTPAHENIGSMLGPRAVAGGSLRITERFPRASARSRRDSPASRCSTRATSAPSAPRRKPAYEAPSPEPRSTARMPARGAASAMAPEKTPAARRLSTRPDTVVEARRALRDRAPGTRGAAGAGCPRPSDFESFQLRNVSPRHFTLGSRRHARRSHGSPCARLRGHAAPASTRPVPRANGATYYRRAGSPRPT
jgi:hypothetical protein